MTADIMPFPGKGTEAETGRAQNARKASEAAARAFIVTLRQDLSARGGGVKLRRKLRRDEDAVLLARRLGADLERVKRLGRGKLFEVLEEAGQPPTSRARFALFADEVPTEKRTRKLQPYVALSDSIARALSADIDIDLFLFEKLRDVDLVESQTEHDEEARTLGSLLERMARAIADKTGLADFFELAGRTPGQIDTLGRMRALRKVGAFEHDLLSEPGIRTEWIAPALDPILRDRRHEGGSDHWTEPQPLPSVPICRILEQTIHGHARISRWAELSPQNLDDLRREVNAKSSEDCALPATVEIWREIGLCLGERHQRGEIGPMFSGKVHVKVHVDGVVAEPLCHEASCENFWPVHENSQFHQSQTLDFLVHGDCCAACQIEVELPESFTWGWIEPAPPPGEPHYGVEYYYSSQHPVNAWNIRRILDRNDHPESPAEALLPWEPEPRMYRFSGYIGGAFENALESGALEKALCADIDRLKRELDRYLAERRETLAAQDEAIAARWGPEERPNSLPDRG